MEQISLRTKRLTLRPLSPDDSCAVFAYRSDKRVLRFQTFRPSDESDVLEFIICHTSSFGVQDTWFQLAICLSLTGALIGDFGLHFLGPDNQQVEIGFTIAPTHQKHGYGFEAAACILAFLFDTLGKSRVLAVVATDNISSITLLEKLGLTQDENSRDGFRGEKLSNHERLYSIASEEWQNRNTAALSE